MDESPVASEKLQLDEQGRLAEDIACRKCGYNLRGLLAESVCPECGTAVGRSTHGDLLRFCDPAWVGTLASGMKWIMAGLVCAVASFGVTILLGGAMGAAGAGAALEWVGLPAGLVSLIGYWKLTTPDPVRIDAERLITVRSLVRIAWGTKWGINILKSVIVASTGLVGLGPATSAVGTVQLALGLIGTIAVFVYVRRLALRIPDERLARSTRVIMCSAGLVTGLIAVLSLIGDLPYRPSPRTSEAIYVVSGCGTVLGFFVFGIWSLILILRYRRAFADARKQAMQSWAQPAAAVDGPMSTD